MDFPSTSEGIKYFIGRFGADMINAIKGTGVHFALAVAENCWESHYGTSTKAIAYNNFAGIKAMSADRRNLIKQQSGVMPGVVLDAKGVKWTSFDNPLQAFRAYALIVSTKPGFAAARTAQTQLNVVVDSGYCTSESGADYHKNVDSIMQFVLKMSNTGIII